MFAKEINLNDTEKQHSIYIIKYKKHIYTNNIKVDNQADLSDLIRNLNI